MSRSSDYDYDMIDDGLADEAIEAFFLGLPHPGWEQDDALASLATDIGAAVKAPPPSPDYALLQLFWSREAPARSATAAASPSATPVDVVLCGGTVGVPRRRLRLLAGVATGMAVAVLGAGAAGATGALPAPAQRVVAGVIEAISPFEVPGANGSDSGRSSRGGDDRIVEDGDAVTSTTTAESNSTIAVRPARSPGAMPSPAPVPQLGAGSDLDRAGRTPAAESIPRVVPAPPSPSTSVNPRGRDGALVEADGAPSTPARPAGPAAAPVTTRGGPAGKP
jgi:hypothetical protein